MSRMGLPGRRLARDLYFRSTLRSASTVPTAESDEELKRPFPLDLFGQPSNLSMSHRVGHSIIFAFATCNGCSGPEPSDFSIALPLDVQGDIFGRSGSPLARKEVER